MRIPRLEKHRLGIGLRIAIALGVSFAAFFAFFMTFILNFSYSSWAFLIAVFVAYVLHAAHIWPWLKYPLILFYFGLFSIHFYAHQGLIPRIESYSSVFGLDADDERNVYFISAGGWLDELYYYKSTLTRPELNVLIAKEDLVFNGKDFSPSTSYLGAGPQWWNRSPKFEYWSLDTVPCSGSSCVDVFFDPKTGETQMVIYTH